MFSLGLVWCVGIPHPTHPRKNWWNKWLIMKIVINSAKEKTRIGAIRLSIFPFMLKIWNNLYNDVNGTHIFYGVQAFNKVNLTDISWHCHTCTSSKCYTFCQSSRKPRPKCTILSLIWLWLTKKSFPRISLFILTNVSKCCRKMTLKYPITD